MPAIAACTGGAAGNADRGTDNSPRVVVLVATNFGYEPASIEVRQGETVRFILQNPTDLPHEMFIGSAESQARHHGAHEAAGFAAAEIPEDAVAAVFVRPNGTGQLKYTFDGPGDYAVGCHLAGHWEAGMRASIVVRR